MNNFSPSTDTSVGTKRFTAQEVQLAYTLMAVEYMKTIKGLNPNHQLVDKAVKLKALGFTNSKEVGDAITSEEDLKVLKCYSFLQRHFPGSLILKEEDFINLNVKYGLVVGRLSAYKGSVPDENIDEISKVMATAQALEANEYVNYSGNGSPLRYVTGMQVATHPMPIDCKNPEPVRGFFNEYLNSELTPHRKVFEVLADKMKTPYQEHQLSGLGFSSTMRNSVIVKVDGTFSRTLKVNF